MTTGAERGVLSPPRGPQAGAIGVSGTYGTFGELLQGTLPDGALPGREDGDFLVTLPIARWTMAAFRAGDDPEALEVRPRHKTKALRLVAMILAELPAPVGGRLTIESTLPEGKGLASSSADLVATARAVGNAVGLAMPPRRIERYLARIEPTDGVLYPGIVAFQHRSVRLLARLGSLPPMTVVGVDEGGAVDTVDFNRIPKPFTAAHKREYAELLDRLTGAVARHDLPAVGAVATRSAELNQVLRHKWTLEPLRGVCAEVGGLGVVTSHSGTTLGVLLDPADPAYAHRLAATAQACEELVGNVTVYRTLSFP